MRILRLLRYLLYALAAVLLLCLLAAGVLWWRPGLLLNEKTIRLALTRAPPTFSARWDSFSWDFAPAGWLGKSTDIHLTGLCVRRGRELSACAREVRLRFTFTLAHLRPRLTRLDELRLLVDELHLSPGPSTEAPVRKTAAKHRRLRLEPFVPPHIGDVMVELNRLRIESADAAPLVGSLRLERVPNHAVAREIRFRLAAHARRRGDFDLRLGGLVALDPAEPAFLWKGTLRGSAGPWKGSMPLTLALNGQGLALRTGRVPLLPLFPGRRLLVDKCEARSRFAFHGRVGTYPDQSEIHCGLTLYSIERPILPPFRFALHASAALRPKREGQWLEADLRFKESGFSPYLDSRIAASALLGINSDTRELAGDPQPAFEARLHIPDLSRWKTSLDETPLAVPAPFRAMKGPATLGVRLAHASPLGLELRASLSSNFLGERQSFVTRSEAVALIDHPWESRRRIEINASVGLEQVRLTAPPLSLEEPPRFLPDKRFFASHKAEALALERERRAETSLAWRLRLRTHAPLWIDTNLLPSPIPVALALGLGGETGLDGSIELLTMPLEVFRKRAELKSLKLNFHPGSSVAELNGRVDYHNPEVLIRIFLLGSTEKPIVELESDPPLSRQQIVAVLLFNKSVTELSEEEASSTASLSQATADGALGLLSLLFLSSTPIESLSYDPATQTYSARVRLDKKTTLSVGSNFETERQVALRRRLGGPWAIRTEVHQEENRPDVLLTLLEWFKRF